MALYKNCIKETVINFSPYFRASAHNVSAIIALHLLTSFRCTSVVAPQAKHFGK